VRILYVSAYPPAVDGIGDYTAALAGAVRDDGHDVRVVTARPVDGAPDEVLGALPRSRGALADLLERIDAWDPDVVHVQFAVAMFGTRLRALVRLMAALRARRANVVVTLHEVTRDTGSLRAAGRAIYRRVAGLADRVVVHTEQSRAALTGPVGAAVEPVVVAHPRRELPTATASASELRARHGLGAGTVLLSFGFIHVDKGLDDLVDALARLGRRDVRLAVAGTVRRRQGVFRVFELRDRAHLRRVRRLIRRCGLDDHVVFAGYVPEGEVRAWFELAAAAVLPYRRIEQSGVANLAVAAGTPVLASEVGGITEIGDPRWRFPARDPERLARGLEDFLAWRDGRGDSRPSREAGHDLESFANATVAIYA